MDNRKIIAELQELDKFCQGYAWYNSDLRNYIKRRIEELSND